MSSTPGPKLFVPSVLITQKPLAALRDYHGIPSNLALFHDLDSWAIDFGFSDIAFGIEFKRDSMRYFIPGFYSKDITQEYAIRMLAYLKRQYLGLNGQAQLIPSDITNHTKKMIWIMTVLRYDHDGLGHRDPLYFRQIPALRLVAPFITLALTVPGDLRCIIRYQPRSTGANKANHDFNLEVSFVYFLPPSISAAASNLQIQEIDSKLQSLNFKFERYRSHIIGISDLRIPYSAPSSRSLSSSSSAASLQSTVSCSSARSSSFYYLQDLLWNQIWDSHDINNSIGFFDPTYFDFMFPQEIALPQAFTCPNEIFSLVPKDTNPQQLISLGTKLSYGVPTIDVGTQHIDHLTSHMGIYGTTNCGKTTYLLTLVDQLNRQRPEVGVLVINLVKADQTSLYAPRVDQVIEYGDELCKIPYFLDEIPRTTSQYRNPMSASSLSFLTQTANILTAGLGLAEPINHILGKLLKIAADDHNCFSTLSQLFTSFKKFMDLYKYGPEVQNNIVRAFENRWRTIVDPLFDRTTAYQHHMPEWFNWWLHGQSIFLDLSPCRDPLAQKLLVFCLLNLIRILTSELPNSVNHLQNLVILDEAHRILACHPSHSDSDYAVSETMMTDLIAQFLTEFRSRGLGMVVSDQSPADLIPAVCSNTILSVLFTLNARHSEVFIKDLALQTTLQSLPRFTAYVLNRINGENYFVRSSPPSLVHRQLSVPSMDHIPWFYQKCLNSPHYSHPDLLEPDVKSYFALRISTLLTHGAYLSVITLLYAQGLTHMIRINRFYGEPFPFTRFQPTFWALFDFYAQHPTFVFPALTLPRLPFASLLQQDPLFHDLSSPSVGDSPSGCASGSSGSAASSFSVPYSLFRKMALELFQLADTPSRVKSCSFLSTLAPRTHLFQTGLEFYLSTLTRFVFLDSDPFLASSPPSPLPSSPLSPSSSSPTSLTSPSSPPPDGTRASSTSPTPPTSLASSPRRCSN